MRVIIDIVFYAIFVVIMSVGGTIYVCSGIIAMEIDKWWQERRCRKKECVNENQTARREC